MCFTGDQCAQTTYWALRCPTINPECGDGQRPSQELSPSVQLICYSQSQGVSPIEFPSPREYWANEEFGRLW